MYRFPLIAFSLLAIVVPASAITVSSPSSGAQVTSPFALIATAGPCSSQPVTSIGYSFDNSSATTIIKGTSANVQIVGPSGVHMLRVKSWGNKGAACMTNVPISISAQTVSQSVPPVVPANAIAVKDIHTLGNWKGVFDTGTNGTADGVMTMVSNPAVSGNARQFATSYTNHGGVRYYVSFDNDRVATNFLYDGWVYIQSPNTSVANLELDMNQTMPNGDTVIFGFQCDGYSNTWDYSTNAGTAKAPKGAWLHSTQSCNPRNWSTNTWHHVQISYSRDNSGNVNYKTVWLDGTQQDINATTFSAYTLGWGSALVTNFQVDGLGTSGSATMYLDNLSVYRW
jgi:hypothetical protein